VTCLVFFLYSGNDAKSYIKLENYREKVDERRQVRDGD
jgi:hypothetical protein